MCGVDYSFERVRGLERERKRDEKMKSEGGDGITAHRASGSEKGGSTSENSEKDGTSIILKVSSRIEATCVQLKHESVRS